MTKRPLNGITECRFEPLHKGHVFMVRMALGLLAEEARLHSSEYILHVIVCSHDGEIISGKERFNWAQQTFGGDPNITVHWAHNTLEKVAGYGSDYSGLEYGSNWEFWGKVATEVCGLGDTVDFVYGSEEYVAGIAAACGAQPVKIDENRDTLQVSGTIMRHSPYNNWDNFPDAVKPYFAKKVCIIGGPYTGKAKLADNLSRHYGTPMIDDVSDSVYNADERGSTPEDLIKIATLHTVRANALLEQANKVIISDSDTLLTYVWYKALFGEPPKYLTELANTKRFDLYLLTDSKNEPFRASHSFPTEESWHKFTATLKAELETRGWPYVVLDDKLLPRRVTNAVVAIDELRWSPGKTSSIGWHYDTEIN